ncbi:unnamed protein product [Effrenium voratum]|nr:unnamed protein product [Effrenium voratum]
MTEEQSEPVYPFDRSGPTDEEEEAADWPRFREQTRSSPPARTGSFSRAKLSMPDSMEIAKMREEFLQREPRLFPRRVQARRVELYFLLEEPASSFWARWVSFCMFACILFSIALFMLETMPELKEVPDEFWTVSECFFTVVFLLEYIFRLLVCDVAGITLWTFIRTPMNVVDVVAVLPFFLFLALQSVGRAIGFIRAVRLVRLFRIFKLGRHSKGLKMMMVALSNSGQALSVLVFFLGIGCVLFSSLLYHVEKISCPDRQSFNSTTLEIYLSECSTKLQRTSQFGLCCTESGASMEFPSISSAFWWSAVTMATTGYGDSRPHTEAGKLAGSVTMCSGILLFALPIALIGARFQEAYNMAVSRGSPSQQVRKRTKDREDPPSKVMSTRLRLLRFSNSSMTRLTKELAKELEEASTMQEDIRMFEKAERESQKNVLKQGIVIVQSLQRFSDIALENRRSREAREAEDARRASKGSISEGSEVPVVPAVILPNQPDPVPPPQGRPKWRNTVSFSEPDASCEDF